MSQDYVYGITIKAGGKAQVVAEFQGVEKALMGLASTAADTSKKTGAAGTAAADYAKELETLLNRIDPVRRATATFNEGLVVLEKGYKSGNIALETYLSGLESLNREHLSVAASSAVASKSASQITQEFNQASDSTDALKSSIKGIAATLIAGFGLNELLRTVNEYTKFTSQLKLATRSQSEYAESYQNTIRIAKTAQTEIGAVGLLYARTDNSLKQLNATESQIAAITETVALSLKVSGATAEEESSAILQLSQAFGSGVLRGEEFNAVNEAAPALMRALAQSLGVPIGALRNMASQGQLTSDVLANAFKNPALIASLREQAKEVRTISGSYVDLKNDLTIAIGEFDKSTGVSNAVAGAIGGIGKNLDIVVPGIAGLVAGLIALNGPAVVSAITSVGALIAALELPIVAVIGVVTALGVAYAKLSKDGRTDLQKLIDKEYELKRARGEIGPTPKTLGTIQSENDIKAYREATDEVTRRQKEIANLRNQILLKTGDELTSEAELQSLRNKEIELTDKLNIADQKRVELQKIAAEGHAKESKLTAGTTANYEALAKTIGVTSLKLKVFAEQEKEINSLRAAGTITQAQATEALAKIAENRANLLNGIAKKSSELNAQQKEQLKELQNEINAEADLTVERYKEKLKAQKEFTDGLAASRLNLETLVASSDANIEKTQREIDVFYIGEQRVTALEVARLRETAATYEQNAAWAKQNGVAQENIKYLEQQADAYRRLADSREKSDQLDTQLNGLKEAKKKQEELEKERVNAIKKSNDEQLRDFQKTQDGIDQIFREGFASMLNSGTSSYKAWTKQLVTVTKTELADTLYKLFARPYIVNIVASIFGITGATGAATAAANTLGTSSIANNVISGTDSSSLLMRIGNGINSLNTNLVGSIEKLGAFIANGNGGIADTVGGALGQYSNQIASGMAYLPAIYNLLNGDIKGAALSGVGALIGNSIAGPVGGAIGAAAGNLLSSFFGGERGKGDRSQSTFSNGTFVNNAQFSGDKGGSLGAGDSLTSLSKVFSTTVYDYLSKFGINSTIYTDLSYGSKGDKSHGDLSGTVNGAGFANYIEGDFKAVVESMLSVGIVKAIQSSTLNGNIKALFNGLTDRTAVSNMLTATVNLKTQQTALAASFGITADQAAKVAIVSGKSGNSAITFFNNIISVSNSFKTAGQQLIETRDSLAKYLNIPLPKTLEEYDAVLKSINKNSDAGAAKFAKLFDARTSVANYLSASDAIKNNVNNAAFSIQTPQQQLVTMQTELSKMFAKLNLSVPKSKEELLNLAKSIDYTTQSGLDLAVAFPNLVTAFDNTQNKINEVTGALDALANIDMSQFKTLVEYAQYKRVASVYGVPFANSNVKSLPSFATGTNYLPSDMIIQAHEGERIVPKADNLELMNKLGDNAAFESLISEVKTLRSDMRAGQEAIAKYTNQTSTILKKFDADGLPATRAAS